MIHMHPFVYLICLLFVSPVCAQNSLNVELLGQANRGDARYSGSWSYVAPDGSEYALIGAKTGTAAYNIDDPENLTELGFIPGPETNWREITVIDDHAFVVTDVSGTGHAMQVIDLGYLPDSLHLDTSYTETFTKGHIIQKDIFNEAPYVYVMGTSTTQGVHIMDVSDPGSPVEVGVYAPGYYIHDAHIRGDILFAAAFYNFEVDIVDISDKSDPQLIGKITYDGKNTHSASSTEDGKYLIVADEADGFPARIFNIEDLENPYEVATFTANEESLVHNPYVRGDFCFLSHNTEGLRVLDIADPELPVEVGFYDTWSGSSGGFSGLWSACPYFPSGKIIGGNRHDGLYVWSFNNTRAARIYGVVVDSLTGESLALASVVFTAPGDTLQTGISGNFKKGILAGDYTLETTLAGYEPKTLSVSLEEGDSMWLEIRLKPIMTQTNEQLHLKRKLLPYPNPSSSGFGIDLLKWPDARTISVTRSDGKLLLNEKLHGQSQWNSPDDLKPGNYFLKICDITGNTIAVATVVIL